ncbi:unnamed protein product [Gadus morhua 'NCC']
MFPLIVPRQGRTLPAETRNRWFLTSPDTWRAVWANQICLRARIADDMAESTSTVIWARADKASTSVVQRKSEQPSPFLQAAYPPNRSAAGIICRREGHRGPGLGNTGPDPISWASTLHRDCEPHNFRSSRNLLCTGDICAITS